ncbi:hypothetical protein WBG83_04790 [Paenibacillus sp. y28]
MRERNESDASRLLFIRRNNGFVCPEKEANTLYGKRGLLKAHAKNGAVREGYPS